MVKVPQTDKVEGKPPRWTPLARATKLAEDSGEYFRDKNAARFPKHPMEPAILALLARDPTIRANVDVVACGSTIGNLLPFVRNSDKRFRILVELVEDAVFFIRRENSPTELIPGVHGYGHTFPEAYTSWDPDVKGSSSHQRLLQYSFGGLDLLVRFEGDGYTAATPSASKKPPDATLDDLISGLANERISERVSPGLHLKVQYAGEVIDQNLIFDLKTRSIKKKDQDTLGEELPRLWIAQISNFVLGYHTYGVFDDIEIRDVHKDVVEWEKTHNKDLSKLAALIHRVISEARIKADGKLELYHDGSGKLEIRAQRPEAGDALSVETRALWIGKANTEETLGNAHEETPEDDIAWAGDEDYTACTEGCGYCGHCSY
jgi:hypothetical protein